MLIFLTSICSSLLLASTQFAPYLNMLRLKSSESKYLRYMVTSVLSAMFLYSVVKNFIKYQEGKTVVAQSIKSASDVVYPSVTICSRYKFEYALSKFSGTKNLTEYYENILNMSLRRDIIQISQPYRTKKG